MTLDELYKTILARKTNQQPNSYVASLFASGDDRIIQKVGEEATEVVIAAKNSSKERLISEIVDLLFHLLVLLASRGIPLDEILIELEKRKR